MLLASDVTAWLAARGVTAFLESGRELPEAPDRVVAVALAGGGPTSQERVFDNPQIQVLARGAQAAPEDAELLAEQVDDLLLGAVPPLLMGAKRVISIDRLGGPPTVVDRDRGRRSVVSTNYIVKVARSVF